MYITIYEVDHQSKFDAWNSALKAGTLEQPRAVGREGDRRGAKDEGHMYTHDWFISVCGKNHYDLVK